jgi:hypothetical protein
LSKVVPANEIERSLPAKEEEEVENAADFTTTATVDTHSVVELDEAVVAALVEDGTNVLPATNLELLEIAPNESELYDDESETPDAISDPGLVASTPEESLIAQEEAIRRMNNEVLEQRMITPLPDLRLIVSAETENESDAPTFIEHLKTYVESLELEDITIRQEVPALVEVMEHLVEQVEQLQKAGQFTEQKMEEIEEQLTIISKRFLECLGDDASEESVKYFVQLLIKNKQYIVEEIETAQQIHEEGTHEKKKFTLEGIGYIAQDVRNTFVELGRFAVAAL